MTLKDYKQSTTITVLRVNCTTEPRGDHGLEGFNLGDQYEAEVDPTGSVALFIPSELSFAGEKQFAGRVSAGVADRYFEPVRSVPEKEQRQ